VALNVIFMPQQKGNRIWESLGSLSSNTDPVICYLGELGVVI
jgi:hypothetical protein